MGYSTNNFDACASAHLVTVVNWTCHSTKEGSIEITLTDPFNFACSILLGTQGLGA